MQILMYERKNKRPLLPIVNKTIKQGKENDWNSKEGLWGTHAIKQKRPTNCPLLINSHLANEPFFQAH